MRRRGLPVRADAGLALMLNLCHSGASYISIRHAVRVLKFKKCTVKIELRKVPCTVSLVLLNTRQKGAHVR